MKQKYSKDFEGTQKAPGDERDLCSRGLSKHDAHSCTSTLHPSAFALAPSRFTIHTQTIASTTTSTSLGQSWRRKWVASHPLPTGKAAMVFRVSGCVGARRGPVVRETRAPGANL